MGKIISIEDKQFDLTFDRIPVTQISPEFFGLRLHTQKAKDLWKKFQKENKLFYYPYYDDRISNVDVLIPTTFLKGGHGNMKCKINPILEFVTLARDRGLHTNEYE